jgi:protein disulfide-isomerase
LPTVLILKVNFEGLGNTGYVAGGPVAWLAVQIKSLKRNNTMV